MNEQNKKYIVGAVLIVIFGWLLILSLRGGTIERVVEKTLEKVGVSNENGGVFGGTTGLNTLCLSESGDQVCQSWAAGTLGTGTSTDSWLNNVGQDVILDYAEIAPTTRASSTIEVWMATSTGATSTMPDYVNPRQGLPFTEALGFGVENMIIGSTTIATGTQPIAANILSSINLVNATFGGTRAATTTILIKSGERVVTGVRSPSTFCGGSVGATVSARSCESATSTGRVLLKWRIRYHYQQAQ